MSSQAEPEMETETAVINNLPIELLFIIFRKLDGCSLARVSCVCWHWRNIVYNLSKGRRDNIWYRRCLEELGLDLMIADTRIPSLVTENGHPIAQSSRWEFWRDFYAANQRCKRVGSKGWMGKMLHVKRVGERQKKMSVRAATVHPCARLRGGGRMYVGLENGSVYYIDLEQAIERNDDSNCLRGKRPKRSLLPINRSCFLESADLISIVNLGPDECPGYSPEKGEDNTLVASASSGCTIAGAHMMYGTIIDRTICLMLTQVCNLTNHVRSGICMSSLGSYIAFDDCSPFRTGVIVCRMFEKERGKPECQTVLQLCGPRPANVSAIALAHNKVVKGDRKGNLYCWCFPSLSTYDTKKPFRQRDCAHCRSTDCLSLSCVKDQEIETINTPTHHIKLPYGVSQVVIHQDQVFALTRPEKANVYVINMADWSRKRCIFQKCHLECLYTGRCSRIMSLAACGPLLAVGFSTGEVVVFNVSSQDWIKNMSASVVSLIRFPIRSLVALNFVHEPEGPALIASGDCTYLCRWRKCQEEVHGENISGIEFIKKNNRLSDSCFGTCSIFAGTE